METSKTRIVTQASEYERSRASDELQREICALEYLQGRVLHYEKHRFIAKSTGRTKYPEEDELEQRAQISVEERLGLELWWYRSKMKTALGVDHFDRKDIENWYKLVCGRKIPHPLVILTPSTARFLAGKARSDLILDEVETISGNSLLALSRHRGLLSMRGLKDVSLPELWDLVEHHDGMVVLPLILQKALLEWIEKQPLLSIRKDVTLYTMKTRCKSEFETN